jgi:hypothetical protein
VTAEGNAIQLLPAGWPATIWSSGQLRFVSGYSPDDLLMWLRAANENQDSGGSSLSRRLAKTQYRLTVDANGFQLARNLSLLGGPLAAEAIFDARIAPSNGGTLVTGLVRMPFIRLAMVIAFILFGVAAAIGLPNGAPVLVACGVGVFLYASTRFRGLHDDLQGFAAALAPIAVQEVTPLAPEIREGPKVAPHPFGRTAAACFLVGTMLFSIAGVLLNGSRLARGPASILDAGLLLALLSSPILAIGMLTVWRLAQDRGSSPLAVFVAPLNPLMAREAASVLGLRRTFTMIVWCFLLALSVAVAVVSGPPFFRWA